jgi:5-(carboxyamino)imidazole ribonucleotide synthase
MLALAAARLGVGARFYEPRETGPSVGVGERFVGEWDDAPRLRAFLEGCDVVTLDNEWVELDAVAELLPPNVSLWPSRETLSKVSNKLLQKRHAVAHGVPVGAFRECGTWDEVLAAADAFGFPVVVKRLRHGYDGYGTGTARTIEELRSAYARMAQDGVVLVEAWVPYVRELSAVMARRPDGKDVVYPIALTRQHDHRCAAVEVPAPITDDVARRATAVARATAEAFDVVGVMAIELFELANGVLLFNELAPRPHNSGHYTIDACVTSQFENHLRAILGWPLGDVGLLRPASVMVNVLGDRTGAASADPSLALEVPGAFVHLYGKRDVKPLRKMGHVTTIGDDLDEVRERAHRAATMVHP